jgi:hypothetical protein
VLRGCACLKIEGRSYRPALQPIYNGRWDVGSGDSKWLLEVGLSGIVFNRGSAIELGRKYGQNAIVIGGKKGCLPNF